MSGPEKKRDGPPRARPIIHKGVRYSAETITEETWGSDPLPPTASVRVVARDPESDAILWQQELFEIRYDPHMERDKQDVVVTSLGVNLFGSKLKIADEKGRRWEIDLKSHALSGG
jgi:hypothetical protein